MDLVEHAEPTQAASESPPSRLAVLALIAANLVPAVGVLGFGWDPQGLLLVYWFESAVIGLYNVPRIVLSPLRPGAAPTKGLPIKLFVAAFFAVHYGLFMIGHLIILTVLAGLSASGSSPALATAREFITGGTAQLAVAGFLISHGVSFVRNDILRGEFRVRTATQQMASVYGRILAMHIAILFGGALFIFLRAPAAALLILIAAKIALDLTAHLRSHRPASMVRSASAAKS